MGGGVADRKLVAPAESAADPNIMIPVIAAALASQPDTKLIAYPGGQPLGKGLQHPLAVRSHLQGGAPFTQRLVPGHRLPAAGRQPAQPIQPNRPAAGRKPG